MCAMSNAIFVRFQEHPQCVLSGMRSDVCCQAGSPMYAVRNGEDGVEGSAGPTDRPDCFQKIADVGKR